MAKSVERKFEKALQELSQAQIETLRLELIDRILTLKIKRFITESEFVSAKEILLFKTNNESGINIIAFETFIDDVESSYQLFKEGIITLSLYKQIIQHRISDYALIHKLYKEEYNTCYHLVHHIKIISEIHKYGAINKNTYDSLINECLNGKDFNHLYRAYHRVIKKLKEGYIIKNCSINSFQARITITKDNRIETVKILKESTKEWIIIFATSFLILLFLCSLIS